jgi:hypothetical protein
VKPLDGLSMLGRSNLLGGPLVSSFYDCPFVVDNSSHLVAGDLDRCGDFIWSTFDTLTIVGSDYEAKQIRGEVDLRTIRTDEK